MTRSPHSDTVVAGLDHDERASNRLKAWLVFVAIAVFATVAEAEIPRSTAAALQNRSPEKLLIEVQAVEKKRNGTGGFDLHINARVLEVEKSDTGLKKGASLTIRYWLHDPDKPVPSGSYPVELEKGKKYRAYLGPPGRVYRHLADEKQKIYFPTAASGSFEIGVDPEPAQSEERSSDHEGELYELRTYTTLDGRLDALNARFRDHTVKLFKKHGMESIGYWMPTDGEKASNTLIYVLRHKSREAAAASWKAFASDPEWKKVAAESQKDGKILAQRPESVYMEATDYSPNCEIGDSDEDDVFELRIYKAREGKLARLDARFRDHTIRLFEKHGMKSMAYWHPIDEPDSNDTLIYIIKHNNRDAARKSWRAFVADPAWKKAARESGVGKLAKPSESIYMKATDYSVRARNAAADTARDRPNILFIAVDDLRPELNSYDGKPMPIQAKTPHLDRLAASGLQFTRAYCNQAVCGASRLSLMSGLYPEFTGERNHHVTGWRQRWGGVVTMNQHFKANGYTTIGLGKIYHGTAGPGVDPEHWTQWVQVGGQRYVIPENAKKASAFYKDRKNNKNGPSTESADVDDGVYLDGHRAAEGVRQINQLSTSDKPFFLAVGFAKPHLPFNSPTRYWDLYQRDDFRMPENLGIPPGYPEWASNVGAAELRNYGDIPRRATKDFPQELNLRLIHGYHACVSYMDHCVGQLLSALEESGLADNTIVVFWGDHGWKLGDHSSWCKHTNFECDTRVPLMIRYPKMKEARGESQALVELIDLYPTLCELSGLDLPRHLQGQSLVPILKDPASNHRDYAYSTYPHRNTDTKRQVVGHSIRNDRVRYTEWWEEGSDKIVARVATDLHADPGETTNLLPENKALANQLSADLKQLVLATRQTPGLEYRAGTESAVNGSSDRGTPNNTQESPLLKELNLTGEQKPRFLAIQKAKTEKWAELGKLPANERQPEQEAFFKARHAEIVELLTPKQMKTYRAFQQARKKQKQP